jgi:hypothetical protein
VYAEFYSRMHRLQPESSSFKHVYELSTFCSAHTRLLNGFSAAASVLQCSMTGTGLRAAGMPCAAEHNGHTCQRHQREAAIVYRLR